MQRQDEAEELLRAVGAHYASLQAYRDHGRVLRPGSSVALVQFRTLFARNTGLRFEFTRDGRTEIVSRSITEPEALMEALAGPTGITAGAAHTIPALLLPEVSGEDWSLLRLGAARMMPTANQSAPERCVWITGTGWAGQPLRVAVDRATLLIRRLADDGRRIIRPHSTDYEPDVTTPVAPEEVLRVVPREL